MGSVFVASWLFNTMYLDRCPYCGRPGTLRLINSEYLYTSKDGEVYYRRTYQCEHCKRIITRTEVEITKMMKNEIDR